MSDMTAMEREFGWEDEIQNDGAPFKILPEGDYTFRVKKFERARHSGSEKIPPCNKAVLTVELSNADGSGEIQTNLFLHSKFEWKLCQFFTAIGQRKPGEAMKMNWGAVPGASGVCHVGTRKWTDNNGKERESNEVTEFYDPEKALKVRDSAAQSGTTQSGGQEFIELPQGTPTPWSGGNF